MDLHWCRVSVDMAIKNYVLIVWFGVELSLDLTVKQMQLLAV